MTMTFIRSFVHLSLETLQACNMKSMPLVAVYISAHLSFCKVASYFCVVHGLQHEVS